MWKKIKIRVKCFKVSLNMAAYWCSSVISGEGLCMEPWRHQVPGYRAPPRPPDPWWCSWSLQIRQSNQITFTIISYIRIIKYILLFLCRKVTLLWNEKKYTFWFLSLGSNQDRLEVKKKLEICKYEFKKKKLEHLYILNIVNLMEILKMGCSIH